MNSFRSLVEARIKSRPSAEDLTKIRRWRSNCRRLEGGGGYCHFVSEWIENTFGWEAHSGTFCSPGGDPVCTAHVWNILPDGSILDATADQLGQKDIMIIPKGSPMHARYRYEYSDDYHPNHPWYPETSGIEWDGQFDIDKENALAKKHGSREWWMTQEEKNRWEKYNQKQKQYGTGKSWGYR